MRFHQLSGLLVFAAVVPCAALAAREDPAVKQYSITVSGAEKTFEIEVGGTVDPENIEILVENVGTTAVENPRLTVNSKYNWYTLEDLVAEITAGCSSEQEKVMAIFDFVEKQTHWWSYPKDRTSLNPLRFFNVYAYHICSQAACQFVGLCRAAGLEARVYEIWHHTVAEAMWDGVWHHLDPDIGVWYLKDDNRTIASIAELEQNPQWVARTYKPYRWYLTSGDNRKMIYKPEADPAGEGLASIYDTEEDNYVEPGYDQWLYQEQNMNLTLRPDEQLVRWWKPVLHKYYDQKRSHEPPRYANGRLTFEPDFSKSAYDGLVERRNVKFKAEDGKSPAVHVDRFQNPRYDRPSSLTISLNSPYVIVGGCIETSYYKGGTSGLDQVSLAADLDPVYHQPTPLWDYYSWAYGPGDCRAVLDDKMLKDGPQATYSFSAEYTLSADSEGAAKPAVFPLVYGGQSGLDRVKIVADLQVNPGSLPALSLGRNVVQYRAHSAGEVRLTWKWREISDQHRPQAPGRALAPSDGAGQAPRFEWSPAADADDDEIVCYRFQLSLRPDCAWPLTQSFDRDVRQGTVFQAPKGWLNQGTTYYWRVRAEDSTGRWSDWSETFSFTTRK